MDSLPAPRLPAQNRATGAASGRHSTTTLYGRRRFRRVWRCPDHQSWRCFSNETCGLQPELRWQSERLSEATNSGDHYHHQRGAGSANFGSGLGIRIQQAGNKQLVPVGITDWLNFTLSGSNGPELEAVPVKEPTTQLAGGDFNASATLVVDYQ